MAVSTPIDNVFEPVFLVIPVEVPSALACSKRSVPPEIVVVPEKVFSPRSVNVAAPALVIPKPEPEITPLMVRLWLVLVVIVRVALRINGIEIVSVKAELAAVVVIGPLSVTEFPPRVKALVAVFVRLIPAMVEAATLSLLGERRAVPVKINALP